MLRKNVVLSVGNTGTVNWTADDDYVLDSVLLLGETPGSSISSLSLDPGLNAGDAFTGSRVSDDFQLNWFDVQMTQVSNIGLLVKKGMIFYLNVVGGGSIANLFLADSLPDLS